jgi:hypothetical protein
MDREEKKKRWAKSLKEAGLIDEMEEEWTLPDELSADTTIEVKGRPASKSGSPAENAQAPFARPIDSVPPGEIRETPEPEVSLSKPAPPPIPDSGKQRLSMGPDAPPVESTLPPTPVVDSMPAVLMGLPDKPSEIPVARVQQAPPPVPPKARSTLSLNQAAKIAADDTPATVQVRGRRITVAPDSNTASVHPTLEANIVDDHPSAAPPPAKDQGPEQADYDSFPAVLMGPPSEKPAGERISDATDLYAQGTEKPRLREMKERFDLGDYSGALEIAEQVLEAEPASKEAAQCRQSCQDTLMQMYESRIGSFENVPKLAISTGEIIWRNLNPATGFVLSRIDGLLTFEDIIDISSLSRFETCLILSNLLQEGIIE